MLTNLSSWIYSGDLVKIDDNDEIVVIDRLKVFYSLLRRGFQFSDHE